MRSRDESATPFGFAVAPHTRRDAESSRPRRTHATPVGCHPRGVTRSLAHISDLHLARDRRAELAAFEDAFAPLLDEGRVVIVPGNHDRASDDAGATLMVGSRVGVADL